jgi:serine/threonine protein kinase
MAKRPERIGQWQLGEQIGRGGQGSVFAANRGEANETCALKIVEASRTKRIKRFEQEIAAHSELSNKGSANVIPILDHGFEDLGGGRVRGYIVMPKANCSLHEVISIFAGRVELCLEVFQGIVNGIREAHEVGVIHRDIKPANVLFVEDSLTRPLLADFGICFAKAEGDDARLTEAGETVGARFFMAPEQERGGKVDVSTAADIYALGKLLHFMLTGRNLHREALNEAFTPEELASDDRFKQILDKILAKCVVCDASARIQTAAELMEMVSALRFGIRDQHRLPAPIPTSVSQPLEFAVRASATELDEGLASVEASFMKYAKAFSEESPERSQLRLDELVDEFELKNAPICAEYRDRPTETKEAVTKLITGQPRAIGAALALARCNSVGLFRDFKRFLEHIANSTERTSGYVATQAIPESQAGFLYMISSLMALHYESWELLQALLNTKFEWHHHSSVPRFFFGFGHPCFFHSDALQRNAGQAHDLYRSLLRDDGLTRVTKLTGEKSLNAYVQTQALMCIKGAQLNEKGVDVRMWADFGRFMGHRVAPLFGRLEADSHFAVGVCRSFEETPTTFSTLLNQRLAYVRKNFFGNGSNYMWDSIGSWDPGSQ